MICFEGADGFLPQLLASELRIEVCGGGIILQRRQRVRHGLNSLGSSGELAPEEGHRSGEAERISDVPSAMFRLHATAVRDRRQQHRDWWLIHRVDRTQDAGGQGLNVLSG